MGWSSWETQRSGCVKALLSLRARGRLLPARELARRCGGEAGVRTTLSLKVKVKMPAQHTVQERRWDRPQASAQGGGGRDQAEEGLSLLLPSGPGGCSEAQRGPQRGRMEPHPSQDAGRGGAFSVAWPTPLPRKPDPLPGAPKREAPSWGWVCVISGRGPGSPVSAHPPPCNSPPWQVCLPSPRLFPHR